MVPAGVGRVNQVLIAEAEGALDLRTSRLMCESAANCFMLSAQQQVNPLAMKGAHLEQD